MLYYYCMKKIITSLFIISLAFVARHAFAVTATVLHIDSVAETSAQISVNTGNDEYLALIKNKTPLKIQWRPWMCGDDQAASIACTMLYVQPFSTTLDYDTDGNPLPVVLTNLQPGIKYRVWLGYDNGMRCFTTPCVSDTWQNSTYSFTTLGKTIPSNPKPTSQVLTQKLRLGSRGAEVIILENFLSDNGYFVGTGGDMRKYIDSFFGTVTKSAVMKFQSDHELKADGIVGAGTRTVINQQLAHLKETR